MNKSILPLALWMSLSFSCTKPHSHDHHEHSQEQSELEPVDLTLYTDHSELFVEFKPLIVGVESRFAAHFTLLGERFLPLEEAEVLLELNVDGKTVSTRATRPEIPGIFRLRLTPEYTGVGDLLFRIKTKDFEDVIRIDSVLVYKDEGEALLKTGGNGAGKATGAITYLKEQAWKVDFANVPVQRRPFQGVIHTSGRILPAPGDEYSISAPVSGIVLFSSRNTFAGSAVGAGAQLFTISGGNYAENNSDLRYQKARSEYEKSKADYERLGQLVEDNIVSQKEYAEKKLNYDKARIEYESLAKNYTRNGHTIKSEITGFVKNILVSEGQYVEAGTPMAIISKNRRLIVRANISQKYFEELPYMRSANFRPVDGNTVYSTSALNGRVVSYGRSTLSDSPFIPLHFEIDNTGNLISGSAAELFIHTKPIGDALVIPVSALMEEFSSFYVYVQISGEQFEKRIVKPGMSDGIQVQILSGLEEGERVVSKGAYQIKLAQASGALPAHGHEH